ncbi:hypothetical protein Sru01_05610 [Sphaerisporangium rufum]|uniref:DUF4190 domain-containing protein n=1 Tax=Sphaerisporangium rufum TaxID=1381558 RepID=A0A919QWT9_9ACTN|nr:hypothetical protein [Sphaerisporangium rufum]GII75579.1 hypothetical protein Sru01_05610 [Sphaerisporangium rufum]
MLPSAETSAVEIGRRALLLSIGAIALTFMVPVLGLALGVFAAVACVRAWRAASGGRAPVFMPVAGLVTSALAILLAASVAWFQTYFDDELGVYTECMKGAGTTTSQQACVADLEHAMESRLPFVPEGGLRLPFAP